MPFTSLRSGLAAEGAVTLAIKVTSVVLGLALTVLLARLLGPKGYGQYAFVYSILLILAIPAQMGLPQLVVRETAKADHARDWGLMRGLWVWSHGCALAVASVLFCGVLAWIALGDSELRLVALFGTLLVPLLALGDIRGAALRGLGRVILGQLPEQVLRPLFLIVLVLAAAALAGPALSPALAMALHVAAAGMAFAIGTALLLRAAPPGVRAERRRYQARAWLISALPLGLITGLHVINNNVALVILGALRPVEEVGILKVALNAGGLVALGLQSINVLIMPRVVRAYAAGERDRLQTLVTTSARLVLACAVPMVLVFLVAGGWLLETAFGAEYRSGYPALALIALGHLANAGFGSVAVLLNMTGHERDTLLGVGVATAANVAFSLALVPAYGVLGAAAASTITMLSWNALLCWRVWKRLGMNSTAFRLRPRRTEA